MNVDHVAIQSALRTYVKTLSVCEALAVSDVPILGASTSGYTRADGGSFLDDGFAKGMEVLGAAFTKSQNNGARTITAVSDSLLSCAGCVAETAAEGPTLEVGLPATVSWENVRFKTKQVGVPFVVEQYVPGPSFQEENQGGDVVLRPMYAVHIHVPADTDIYADGAYTDALINHFAPGTSIAIGDGNFIQVRYNPAVFRGQRINPDSGFSMIPVTVPLEVRVPNN